MERRLAAILFTDVVDYTALMGRDEAAGRRVRARHEALVRAQVTPPQAPDGMNSRGDGLQKSGHILYTKGCPGWKPTPRSSVSISIATT